MSAAYEPELRKADIPGQLQEMRLDAVKALENMFADCIAATGEKLISVSGYRSYQRQATIYSNKVKSSGSKQKADQYVARPGASEHQLGLAIDIGRKADRNLSQAFGRTAAGKWCSEPWHFR